MFLHWPLPPEVVATTLPPGIELDVYGGMAWLAVVPFQLSFAPRGLHVSPYRRRFDELNLRTYVRRNGLPGVYFYSLDAGDPFSVLMARTFYRLPYLNADMASHWDDASERVHFHSRRTHRGQPEAVFQATYQPTGAPFRPEPGSLEEFLLNRFTLFTPGPGACWLKAEIHHPPWPLQPAGCEVNLNTLPASAGFSLTDPLQPPVAHYVRSMDMVAWPPQLA